MYLYVFVCVFVICNCTIAHGVINYTPMTHVYLPLVTVKARLINHHHNLFFTFLSIWILLFKFVWIMSYFLFCMWNHRKPQQMHDSFWQNMRSPLWYMYYRHACIYDVWGFFIVCFFPFACLRLQKTQMYDSFSQIMLSLLMQFWIIKAASQF